MYAAHFRLRKVPFSIAPDPHFLFMSAQHREALAHLLYGVGGGGGFVLLTGEIGAGKTTVCRCFLEQVPPKCDVAYIFNPKLSVGELLSTIAQEFRVPVREGASVKEHVDALNAFLLRNHAAGRSAVLIIDEAQALAPDLLEQLRLLTNLETHERKLLQIVLIGQPELRDMLARPGLEQLAQRVIARYHLGALTPAETEAYVRHRIAVAAPAGEAPRLPFDAAALARLHRLTGGVPRRINLLADRALLGAYSLGRRKVDAEILSKAAAEVFDRPAGAGRWPALSPRGWLAAAALVALLVGGLGLAVAPGLWRGGLPWRAAPAVAAPGGAPAAPGADVAGRGTAAVVEGRASATLAAAGVAPGVPVGAALNGATPSAAVPQGAAQGATAAASGAARADGRAAAEPPALADTAMALEAAFTDEGAAVRALAAAWRVELPAAGDACRAAAASGLACFRSRAGLPAVRQLGRPGVLVLRDAAGRPLHARLVALGEREALLAGGSRTLRVPLATLAGVWRGEFLTLWRPPPEWRDGAGSDAARDWIQARLHKAGYGDARRTLAERIWAFQVGAGLEPDGVAGPLTLMQLSRIDPGEPGGLPPEPRLEGAS